MTDGPVAAVAIFDTENGFATITIQDVLADTRSAGQLISGLEFAFGGLSGTSVLSSSSADLIQVKDRGAVADKGSGSTGWAIGQYGGELILCVVCPGGIPGAPAPSHAMIGPGPYSNANSSIAGSGPHNPMLNQMAVFTITNASIGPNTPVSGVVFSFGTNFGGDLSTVVAVDPVDPVPEPRTYVSIVAGAIGLAFLPRVSRASRDS